MQTMTIRLSDELKARLAAAAERAGETEHSFILDAIVEKTELGEQHAHLTDAADTRLSSIMKCGTTAPWPDMRRYLEGRVTVLNCGQLHRGQSRII